LVLASAAEIGGRTFYFIRRGAAGRGFAELARWLVPGRV